MNTIENKIPFTTAPVSSEEPTEDLTKKEIPESKTREKLLKKIKRAKEIDEMMTFSKNLKLR
jgi:hypothetical protein